MTAAFDGPGDADILTDKRSGCHFSYQPLSATQEVVEASDTGRVPVSGDSPVGSLLSASRW
jgi:hypothetical protein